MKKERRYDLVFVMIAAGILALLYETSNSQIIEKYGLIFVLLSYFVGKGVGKGVKEKEWREKSNEENDSAGT